MISRENFRLDPNQKEREIIEIIKENPKNYIESELKIEMERRFERSSAGELIKYEKVGSKNRMDLIDSFLNYYEFLIKKAEKITGAKLHESFYLASQKPVLIGEVLEKVIKSAVKKERDEAQKVQEEESRRFRGKSKYPPDTLHYGD